MMPICMHEHHQIPLQSCMMARIFILHKCVFDYLQPWYLHYQSKLMAEQKLTKRFTVLRIRYGQKPCFLRHQGRPSLSTKEWCWQRSCCTLDFFFNVDTYWHFHIMLKLHDTILHSSINLKVYSTFSVCHEIPDSILWACKQRFSCTQFPTC